MKPTHIPQVNDRYWLAILLASVFGTNLGDLYAHESGLGIGLGLLLLAVLAGLAFMGERRDRRPHEAWYWLVIIIIRTGATNIADWLAFRVRVPPVALGFGLLLLLAGLAWRTHRVARTGPNPDHRLPATNEAYWAAMLTAGVLGTILGDDASHAIGEGPASIGLGLLLGLVLLVTRGKVRSIFTYWGTVAVARTAGTAIGDWLAENRIISIGLPLSTLLTGIAFVAVLLLWRARPNADLHHRDELR
jgi:uncharacterized membrane-anchored protein